MKIDISLNGVDVSALALDTQFKTKNTEVLSMLVAKIIGQMADAGMVLDDGQLSQAELNAIWAQQSAVITNQNAYLQTVYKQFNDKAANKPQQTSWVAEALKDLAASVAGAFVGGFVEGLTSPLGPLSVILAELTGAGTIYGVDYLFKLYHQGTVIVDMMTAENTGLLALTPSRKNYELRSMVISQHDHSITNILLQASQMEAQLTSAGVTSDADWSDWISNMEATGDELENWLDGGMEAEVSLLDNDPSNNLPVPIAPKLPAIPFRKLPTKLPGRSDLPAIVIGEITKMGARALLKYLKKSMERKNFARQNDLIEALKALKYNDEEIDFGAFRAYLRSKIIEY